MKNFIKRAIVILLAVTMLIPLGVSATAYDDLHGWSMDEESGILTVYDNIYSSNRRYPWHNLKSKIKGIVIEHGVTRIEQDAFHGCRNLETVEIADTVEVIGDYAFNLCDKLQAVEMPYRLRSIGRLAFTNCRTLEKVVFHGNLNEICGNAFSNCTALKSVEFRSKNARIDRSVFIGCENLETLKIYEGCEFDSMAFDDCVNIKEIYYTGSEESYRAMPVTEYPYCSIPRAKVYFNQPEEAHIVSVSVASMPEKTRYEIGEELDMTGFALNLEMSDGTDRIFDDLSEMIIGKFYSSSPCTARVTVAYRGYETFTELEILEPDNITIRKVGENVTSAYSERNRTVTISGSGPMYGTRDMPLKPDGLYAKTVIIEEGVTTVNGFYRFENFEELYIPKSVQSIGIDAVIKAGNIYYAGEAEDWAKITFTVGKAAADMPEISGNLYFNGVFHNHSYINETNYKAKCTETVNDKFVCICGHYYNVPVMPAGHVEGEWEDSGDKLVKKCKVCSEVLEEAEKPVEDTESGSEPVSPEEPAEDAGFVEIIVSIFNKIIDAIFGLFRF